MTLRAIPVLALLVLFVASPVLACEAMAKEAEASAQPMDMAGGCTDDDTVQSLCAVPGLSVLASVPGVNVSPAPILLAATPHGWQAEPGILGVPRFPARGPSPPFPSTPVFLLNSAFLI